MSESIESIRRESIEVVDLPVGDIEPDPKNPNVVSPELMESLKEDILERGFVQPVLVRPHKGSYRITDGEHRYRVLKEAGAETIPCVIDDVGEDNGRLRLLTMNRLRGEFVPFKLAQVVGQLAQTMDEDELARRLGMDNDEFDSLREIENAGDDVDERLAASLIHENNAAPVVMTWRLPNDAADRFEAAIAAEVEAGAENRAQALIRLLEA